MINLQGISKFYTRDSVGLHDVSLSIDHGEFVSVVGQSGTGKTTLVKLLIAEERPTQGTISIGDWDITKISQRDIPLLRRQIGVIFQDFKLLPGKTVEENVAFAMQVAGESIKRIRNVVPKVLDIVGLAHKSHRYPTQLSGGEQQRVAVARALINRPAVVFADEPSGNLDSANAKELHELFFKLRDQFQQTFVIVTHNEELANMADRKLTISDGVIVS